MATKRRGFFFGCTACLLSGCGALPDASSVNLQQMIINVAATIPSFVQLCTAGAYLMGFLLVLQGVHKLKEYGEVSSMMGGSRNIWSPLMTLAVGSMLLYFVSSYQVGLQTLFGTSSPSPLTYSGGTDYSEELINAVVLLMQLVGCIAFIRGLLILNSAAGHNAQPGSYGKGITFIVGGLLSINIYGTWQAVINTLVGT